MKKVIFKTVQEHKNLLTQMKSQDELGIWSIRNLGMKLSFKDHNHYLEALKSIGIDYDSLTSEFKKGGMMLSKFREILNDSYKMY